MLTRLAKKGVKRVFVLTPGFTADCLETIDEIGHESAEVFRKAGGEVEIEAAEPPGGDRMPPSYPDLAEVRGQERARRALEIAATGGHNLLLAGPPGTGMTI